MYYRYYIFGFNAYNLKNLSVIYPLMV